MADCEDEDWDNARLIAAAPDLLAACKAVLATADTPCQPDHHGLCQEHNLEPIETCWVLLARAAIARAGGEEKQ
jgi:hypothetical protein